MAKSQVKKEAVEVVEELSEADKYYIKHNVHLSVGELCKNTGKSRTVVSEYVDSVPKSVRADRTSYVSEINNGKAGSRKLAYHEKHKNRGAIVSTQAASEHADDNKGKRQRRRG